MTEITVVEELDASGRRRAVADDLDPAAARQPARPTAEDREALAEFLFWRWREDHPGSLTWESYGEPRARFYEQADAALAWFAARQPARCDGSGRCPATHHTHGCYAEDRMQDEILPGDCPPHGERRRYVAPHRFYIPEPGCTCERVEASPVADGLDPAAVERVRGRPVTARDVIAQALALSEAATDGPWEAAGQAVRAPHLYPDLDDLIADCIDPNDAALTAAARTLLPALAKALGDVLDEMERPVHLDDTDEGCVPVRRLRAIAAALSEVTP